MLANVPLVITASFPLRAPYELNSRGVSLRNNSTILVNIRLKGSFSFLLSPTACSEVCLDCWGSLFVTVESFSYNKKHLEVTVAVILCYRNEIETS